MGAQPAARNSFAPMPSKSTPDTTNITNQTTSTNKMKDQKHISLPSQTLKQLQHSRQQTQHMLRALLGSAYSNSSVIGASPAKYPLEYKEKYNVARVSKTKVAKYAIKMVRYVSDDMLKTDGPFCSMTENTESSTFAVVATSFRAFLRVPMAAGSLDLIVETIGCARVHTLDKAPTTKTSFLCARSCSSSSLAFSSSWKTRSSNPADFSTNLSTR
mmetsp:Transcript_26386/g.87481  ORF Transcript_26386/g.87481 Transcript_26386/m.87481 type:complete len:215 (+) Transcript_26386:329-973(+)